MNLNYNNTFSLFLGGGGDIEQSKVIDDYFFNSISSEDKILYIPVAWDNPNSGYESCYEWFSNLASNFLQVSKSQIVMYTEKDLVIPNIDEFSAIYIGGGNTYKLLDFVLTNKLKKIFQNFIQVKGKIFGGSAGAIIFGKDISTVVEEQKIFLTSAALGFCEGFSIRCHYNDHEDQFYKELSKQHSFPILALPEEGGLILNDQMKIIKTIQKIYLFEDGIKSNFLRG